jgi:integrase
VEYRAGGKSRRETLGRVDTIALETARTTARTILAKVQLGADPHAEKSEAKALQSITLGSVADHYLANKKERLKPRSYKEVEHHLKRHWMPLRSLPLHKINRTLISTRLEQVAREIGPVASNRARAALSAVFTWAMETGQAGDNPVIGSAKFGEESSRDHVLSDAELTAIWSACREDDHGRIIQLLILTGQRRDEVGHMTWAELDFDRALWTIPGKRTKNHRTHEVPLSATAIQILQSVPRHYGRSFVFGEGAGGFSGRGNA